jgi:DNA-binding transcriptional MerR regulator
VSLPDELDNSAVRRPAKSEAAFRTISEVSEDLDVPQHVLRFWESKFPQIKPLKRGGGRRYYRPEDVQLLRRIRDLLYKDGYTIRGVQKLLRETPRVARVTPPADVPAADPAPAVAPAAPPVEAILPHRDGGRPDPMVAPELLRPAGEDGQRVVLQSILTELLELRDLLEQARRVQ